RTRIGAISQFGLMEMTRQRMRPSLRSSLETVCRHCQGRGYTQSAESVLLSVMRRLAVVMHRPDARRVELTISPDVAFHLLNRKRAQLTRLEDRTGAQVLVRVGGAALDFVDVQAFDDSGKALAIELPDGKASLPPPREGAYQRIEDVRRSIDEEEVVGDDNAEDGTANEGPDDEPWGPSLEEAAAEAEADPAGRDSPSYDPGQASEHEFTDAPKKKRRRRRRGGRKRRKSSGEEDGAADSQTEQGAGDEASDGDPEDAAESGDESAKAEQSEGGREKSSAGPKASDAEADDASDAGATGKADDVHESGESEEAAPKTKRRRRRSRKKASSKTGESQNGDEAGGASGGEASDTDAEAKPDAQHSEGDAPDADTSAEESGPKKKRRRRRRSKSSSSKAGGGDGDDSGDAQPASAAGDAEGSGYSNSVVDAGSPA
ncbi:MAG: hypothetical protein AAGA57_03305, partial [Planctomycetota bacterium]